MKRTTLFFATFFACVQLHSQITFEESYEFGFDSELSFWTTEIEEDNTKFVHFDRGENLFHLYNMDHSLYQTIEVPIPIPETHVIGHITKSLFDCDDSNLEYAVMSQTGYDGTFYIFHDDGSLYWSMDSVVGTYCWGCNNGSVVTKPIRNTSAGTKMYLASADVENQYAEVSVFSLCGEVPTGLRLYEEPKNYVQVFPNPSNNEVNFEIIAPSSYLDYKLTILDTQMKVLREMSVLGQRSLKVNAEEFSQGMYFFSLSRETDVVQSGKFQIIK